MEKETLCEDVVTSALEQFEVEHVGKAALAIEQDLRDLRSDLGLDLGDHMVEEIAEALSKRWSVTWDGVCQVGCIQES